MVASLARSPIETLRRWSARAPLTDVRSLCGSILFHVILVIVAASAVFTIAAPAEPDAPRAIQGELDPIDNRAPQHPGQGGGSPGPLGGERLASALESLTSSSEDAAAARPAPSDALLAEILPAPVSSEAVQQALPGPSTSALGLLPGAGPGTGGGGGSGGGVGGGIGRGVGPGTEFFGARESAHSFAYVIDCSGSMATRNSLDMAKRELLASLSQLPADAQFAVVFYNLQANLFSDATGRKGLMAATGVNKVWIEARLREVGPEGGTDHMIALRAALGLRPEVIFFLTDADLMTSSDVNILLAEAGSTRIQAIEFGRGLEVGTSRSPLRRLASATGGTYRYIDVNRFPRTP